MRVLKTISLLILFAEFAVIATAGYTLFFQNSSYTALSALQTQVRLDWFASTLKESVERLDLGSLENDQVASSGAMESTVIQQIQTQIQIEIENARKMALMPIELPREAASRKVFQSVVPPKTHPVLVEKAVKKSRGNRSILIPRTTLEKASLSLTAAPVAVSVNQFDAQARDKLYLIDDQEHVAHGRIQVVVANKVHSQSLVATLDGVLRERALIAGVALAPTETETATKENEELELGSTVAVAASPDALSFEQDLLKIDEAKSLENTNGVIREEADLLFAKSEITDTQLPTPSPSRPLTQLTTQSAAGQPGVNPLVEGGGTPSISAVMAKSVAKEIKRAGRGQKNPRVSSQVPPLPMQWSLNRLATKSVANPQRLSPGPIREYSTFELQAVKVDLLTGQKQRATHFDFRFGYSYNEILSDEGDGQIAFDYSLSGSRSILNATLVNIDFIPTVVDFNLERANSTFNVPVLESDSLQQFVEKHNYSGAGGFVLVELGDDVRAADLDQDAQYEAKWSLNENFQQARTIPQQHYLLFIGVAPGNRVVEYQMVDGRKARKVINVSEGTLYFDLGFLLSDSTKRYEFELVEEPLFGKGQTELNLESEKIKIFNEEKKVLRTGMNRYEVVNPLGAIGSRKYFQLDHLREPIFFGYAGQRKVVLPSGNYIDYVMQELGLSGSKSCVVQVNVGVGLKGFSFEGNAPGGIDIEVKYLNQDGVFSEQITDITEKIFLIGNNQGIVNGKIEYQDGTTDFLQTFCSESTYLIEQF